MKRLCYLFIFCCLIINHNFAQCPSVPLTIITQTAQSPAVVCMNGTATLTATSSGADYYEWQEQINGNWTNIVGATANNSNNASYTTPVLSSPRTFRCRFTNCAGVNEVFSNPITVTPTQPAITTHPISQTDCDGNDNLNFIINAPTATIFQWQRKRPTDASFSNITTTANSVVTNGAGTSNLRINNIGNTENPHQTLYRCVITDANSCMNTSNEAMLSVNSIRNVADVKVCENLNATFSAITVGTLSSIQWQRGTVENMASSYTNLTDGGRISGSTTNNLTIANTTNADNNTFYRFSAVFTTFKNSTAGTCTRTISATAAATGKLTINPAPTAPTVSDVARCDAGTVTLVASGAGTDENYRWYADNSTASSPIQSSGGSFITPSLSTNTDYYVSKTKTYSSPTMTCESLTRSKITAIIHPLPSITLGMTSSACANATSFSLPYSSTSNSPDKFSISVGNPALAGFIPIVDANLTASPLSITKPATSAPATVQFTMKVKNSTTTCESPNQNFNLTLNQPTVITTHPQNTTVCEDGTANFTVVANGSGTLHYQWKKEGTNVGTDSPSLMLSNMQLTDNQANITCEVSSDCGTITSNAGVLTVKAKTQITTQPQSQDICEGATVTFSITAIGSGTLNYQWKKNGLNVGTNSANYTINNASINDNNVSITCTVSGDCGTVTSQTAILTVSPIPNPPTVRTPDNYCQNASATPLSATPSGSNSLLWWGTNSTGGSSSSAITPQTNTTGTFTYYVSQKTIQGCESPRAAINVIVTPTLTVTIAGRDNFCTTGVLNRTTTLTATPSGGDGNYSYQWRNSSGNIASANAISYEVNAGSTYSVEVSSGACRVVSNSISVTSLIGILPFTSVSGNTNVCGTTEITSLTANPTGLIGTYQWYNSSTAISAIASGNPYSATAGTYFVARKLTFLGTECESDRISVTVNNTAPIAPSTINGNKNICTGTSTTLSTTDCGNGLTKWYDAATGGTLLATNNSFTTNNLNSNTTFYVACNASNCESSRTAVAVNVSSPIITTQPSNQTQCRNGSISFQVLPNTFTTYQWQRRVPNGNFVDVTGSSTGIDINTPNTLTATSVGGASNPDLTEFRVIVSQNGCSTTSNVAVLRVNSLNGTLANKTNICEGTATNFDLSGITIVGNTTASPYQWQSSTAETSGYTNLPAVSPFSGVTSNTLSINTVNQSVNNRYFRVNVTFTNTASGTCSVSSNGALLTVASPTTPSILASTNSICGGESVILTATNCNGTVIWSNNSTGTSIIVNPTVNTDYTALCRIGNCDSPNSNTVSITVRGVTPLPTNTTSNFCFGSTLQFSATGTNLLWYTTASGGVGSTTAPTETEGGTYTYYVSQTQNGCESGRLAITASVKKITIDTQPSNQTNCDGNSVTFSLSASYNLSGTLFYQWQRKKPTDATFSNIALANSSSFTIADVGTGEDVNGTQYQCVVWIDGCSVVSDVATLTVNKLTGALASQTVCRGSNVTFNLNSFTITGNITGYQWQKRVGSSGSFTDISGETNASLTINNVSSEDNNTYYKCRVIFSNCNRLTDDARLSVNTLLLTTTPTNVSCNGGSNGQVVVSVSGGSTPYSYSKDGTNFQSSGTFGSLSAGTYTITAKDNINCVTTTTVTISQPDAITVSLNKTDVLCSGDATGSITVTVSGGTGVLTYSKDGGSFQASNIFTNLTAGGYTITVKDGNNCIATNSITVGAGQTTGLPTNTTPSGVCFGSTLQFSATGTNLLWYTTASGGVGITTAPTETVGGTYTYYVSQTQNGCESGRLAITASVKKITIDRQPSNQTNCDGNSVTFSLSASYNLPGTLFYQWQRKKPTDATFSNIALANSSSFTIADVGTGEDVNGTQYQCVVWIDGCSVVSDVATLTVNKLTGALASQTVCRGSNVTFNLNSFTITGNITGYQWQKRVGSSGSFTDISGETNASLTINNVSSEDNNTYYKCRVIFSNCNRLTDDARLSVTSPETPILIGSTTICQGENATLTASSCTGGMVIWSNGASGTSISVSPSTNTDYTAICRVGTCESPASNPINIIVRAGIATPTNLTPASVNAPATLTFSATSSISGATLLWYSSATGGTGSTTAPQFTIPNTYTQFVTQKDPVSGCESPRLAITATIVDVFRISQQPVNQGECQGNTTYFSVRVAGSTTTSYRWQRKRPNETVFTDIGQIDPDLRISNAGNVDNPHLTEYRCIVSDGTTTFTTNTAILKVNSIEGNIPNVGACLGKKAEMNLAFWMKITGSITGYQWQTRPGTSGAWTDLTDGNGIVGSRTSKLEFTNPSFANTAYYRCKISFDTEGNICSEFTDSGRLIVSSYPPPPNTIQYLEYCQFDKATKLSTFDQNPDLDVLWYTSPIGGFGSTVAPTPPTNLPGELKYYVTQRTEEGCESDTRKEVVIKIKPQPALPINKTAESVEEGSPFTFQADGQNLRWYGNQTTKIASNQAPTFVNVGNYTFFVTQTVDGCESNRLQIKASITPILKFTKQPVSQTDCEGNSVTFSLTATGRSSVQYQWQKKLPNTTQFVNIVGEITNSLKISNIGNADNPNGTQFRCEIKDNLESKLSEVVLLNVNSVKGTFNTINLCEGDTATIKLDGLKIIGNIVNYQWQKRINGNFTDILNETKSQLNTSESGVYRARLVFSNAGTNTCSENTSTATVEIKSLPDAPKVVDLSLCQNERKVLSVSPTSGNSLLWYDTATGRTGSTTTPILNTSQVGKSTYFVSQQDRFGCESKRSELSVTIKPSPEKPIVLSQINYCKNAPTEFLKASSDAKNTILWYDTATGGTGSTVTPKPNSESTASYFVSALNSVGCESSRSEIRVVITPCIAALTEDCLQISTENVQGNRWFDIFDLNGKLYASINPNGQNLGRVLLSIKKYPNVPSSSNGTRILQRFADFQSSILNKFEKPVSLRVYHSNQELELYKTSTNQPTLTINDFNIIHYDGIREDCDWMNNDNLANGESILIYKDVKGIPMAADFFALQFDVNSFSEIAATSNDMAEIQFDVKKISNQQVQLDWTTNLEIRAEKFIIQRSKDGKKWSNLLEKKTNGNSSTYQDFDNLPFSGRSFYRLIYIDKDGVRKIFDEKEINIEEVGEPICKAVPNPVSATSNIQIYLRNIQPKEVKMYNSLGQNLTFESKIDENELLNIQTNSFLQGGVYFVKITDGAKACVSKVVKNP